MTIVDGPNYSKPTFTAAVPRHKHLQVHKKDAIEKRHSRRSLGTIERRKNFFEPPRFPKEECFPAPPACLKRRGEG